MSPLPRRLIQEALRQPAVSQPVSTTTPTTTVAPLPTIPQGPSGPGRPTPSTTVTTQPAVTQTVVQDPEKLSLAQQIQKLEQQYIAAGGTVITSVTSLEQLLALPIESLQVLLQATQLLFENLQQQQKLPPGTTEETATSEETLTEEPITEPPPGPTFLEIRLAIDTAAAGGNWAEVIRLGNLGLSQTGFSEVERLFFQRWINKANTALGQATTEETFQAETDPGLMFDQIQVDVQVAAKAGNWAEVLRLGQQALARGGWTKTQLTLIQGWIEIANLQIAAQAETTTETTKELPISFTQPPLTPGTTIGQQITGTDGSVWGWNGTTWVLVPPTATDGGAGGATTGGTAPPTDFLKVLGEQEIGGQTVTIVQLIGGEIGFFVEEPTGQFDAAGNPIMVPKFIRLSTAPTEAAPTGSTGVPTAQEVAGAEIEQLFRLRGGFEPGAFRRVEEVPGFLRALLGRGQEFFTGEQGIGPGIESAGFGFGLGELPPFLAQPTRPFFQQLTPKEIAVLREFANIQNIPFEKIIEQAERLTPLGIEQRIPAIQKKVLAQQRR